jgi:nicotinate phosphoribosyltransferase
MSDALLTDLYELTMMAGYFADGRAEEEATFDLFFRNPPQGLDLVVAAGLDVALDYLEGLAFSSADLDYLASLGRFDEAFLDYLRGLVFSADVWAMPEGVPVFGDEPILRVTGPIAQAQLVETALLSRICYSSLVASTAVAIVRAADGTPVVEYGARRAHGPDGAVTGSRAAVIGGCTATSNVEAGRRFGVPVSGTQAHSWIMSYDSELEAFRVFARTFPDSCVLLVDTYDTLGQGLPNAITVAQELRARGHELVGVRLDSGDLAVLAREARALLDDAGFPDVRIIASGDLDAERLAELRARDAPIDGFGVGTSLITARRDPAFNGVYKLAEVGGKPVLKVSGTPEKTTNPGRKQVWRRGSGDVIGLADEALDGEPLLVEVMRGGRRVSEPTPVATLADRCREAVAAVRPVVEEGRWFVARSQGLSALREDLVARHRATSA